MKKSDKEAADGISTKDDIDKLDITLIDPYFIEGICKILDLGQKKYKRGNWQLSLDPKRILAAAMRHILEMQKGHVIDKESRLPHSLHVACNMQFLFFYHRHKQDINLEHNKG